MTKILHVTTPIFTAQATFEKVRGGWKCISSTPSIDWMEIATLEAIKGWLDRNDYQYRWEAKTDPAAPPTAAVSPGEAIQGQQVSA
jgi:hypothetical protein